MTPSEAVPYLKTVKEEYEEIKSNKDSITPEVVEAVSELASSFAEGLSLYDIFKEMMEFINDNIEDNEKDGEDDRNPDTRIDEFIQEICEFILECFHEKLEVVFFFKTCLLSFGIKIKDFRNALFALGKAYYKFNQGEDGQNNDDEDY